MTRSIRQIAGEGLQQAKAPHWFREQSRQLLAADDALAQIDAVVRDGGSAGEQATVRLMHAAARAEDVPRAALLAVFQEGLAVLASGSAAGPTAQAALLSAVTKRMHDEGIAGASTLRSALTREAGALTRESRPVPPKPLQIASPTRLANELPRTVIMQTDGDVSLIDTKRAEGMLQSRPVHRPRENAAAAPPRTGWWTRFSRWLGFGAVAAAAGPQGAIASRLAALPVMKNPSTPAEFAVAEAFLSDLATKLEESETIGTGVNASLHVALANHSQALWKPSAGEDTSRLRDELEKGRQGHREAAAYIVDRWMGHYGKVPPTVFRKLGGRTGALMWWVHGAVSAESSDKASDIISRPKGATYRRMAVLDNVLGNLDRHDGNWMIQPDGEVVPIDHGLCFPRHNANQGEINHDFSEIVRLDKEAEHALRRLQDDRAAVTAELSQHLGRPAIDAMFERVATMLDKGRTYEEWRA